mmetsp:Transcript_4531/g.9039  ORF Transcript_4531/g.9039 Transcript_4531/m.9039 type:complete len:265 (+) Transcript_4531:366-1160(+)
MDRHSASVGSKAGFWQKRRQSPAALCSRWSVMGNIRSSGRGRADIVSRIHTRRSPSVTCRPPVTSWMHSRKARISVGGRSGRRTSTTRGNRPTKRMSKLISYSEGPDRSPHPTARASAVVSPNPTFSLARPHSKEAAAMLFRGGISWGESITARVAAAACAIPSFAKPEEMGPLDFDMKASMHVSIAIRPPTTASSQSTLLLLKILGSIRANRSLVCVSDSKSKQTGGLPFSNDTTDLSETSEPLPGREGMSARGLLALCSLIT